MFTNRDSIIRLSVILPDTVVNAILILIQLRIYTTLMFNFFQTLLEDKLHKENRQDEMMKQEKKIQKEKETDRYCIQTRICILVSVLDTHIFSCFDYSCYLLLLLLLLILLNLCINIARCLPYNNLTMQHATISCNSASFLWYCTSVCIFLLLLLLPLNLSRIYSDAGEFSPLVAPYIPIIDGF